MKCENCGKVNPSGTKFCVECGNSFSTQPPVPSMEPGPVQEEAPLADKTEKEFEIKCRAKVFNWGFLTVFIASVSGIITDLNKIQWCRPNLTWDHCNYGATGIVFVMPILYLMLFFIARQATKVPFTKSAMSIFNLFVIIASLAAGVSVKNASFSYNERIVGVNAFMWPLFGVFIGVILSILIFKIYKKRVDATAKYWHVFLTIFYLWKLPLWIIQTLIYNVKAVVRFFQKENIHIHSK